MLRKTEITFVLLRTGNYFALGILLIFFLTACSAEKHLKEGETFYTESEIRFDTRGKRIGRRKILRKELQEYITPKPNTKIFGSRPGVWFYYIAGTPKKKKGFKSFIKNKLGEEPVLLKDVAPDRIAKLLSGQLQNEGYFKSEVAAAIETKKRKKESKVIYNVLLYPPYRLRNIHYPKPRDSVYAHILRTLYEESLLKEGQRYDLERMQAEQARIEEEMENYGLFYFDDRYLIFEADSTVGKRKVDLDLRLEEGIPDRAKKIFRLKEVNVVPNYTLSLDSLPPSRDTIKVNRFNYVDSKRNFRPEIITEVINLKKGDTYSREAQELTLSHLMDLGTFKFVNIKFTDVSTGDSALLNTNILLTTLKKKSLRAEVQAVSKSNNFVGPGLSLVFTNRNFLRGAELFELSVNTAYEVQISNQVSGAVNSFELGFESSLTVPRFISPIRIDYSTRKYLPKTQFKLGFNLQNRVRFFRLNTFNAGYGYNWRESAAKSHELFPIDINYIRTDKRSDEFNRLLERNTVLSQSFENQFIVGSRYSYTLNTQLLEDPLGKYEEKKIQTHSLFFKGTIDIAGNLLQAIQKRAHESSEGPFMLFGSPYSQYVRGDIDFRYYWQIDEHNKIATRVITGVGHAYGNSTTMPYIKQFSIGGSNSIRAFPARSIGPGTYTIPRDSNVFIDQRGDIKFETNVEYRFDIVKSFKGAVFVDAGNIWLWRYDSSRVGGKFDADSFYKELAVGTGVGLRMDFSFFVLRFDIAFPLRRPKERWVVDDIDFGSSSWRSDNLVFNIAIGYPF